VPRDLPEGVGMLREAATAPDDIYRIDLKTGAKVPISLDGQDHRVSSLQYDKTSNKLFFTDQNELGVFEVKL
jgi:hypothetical protein